MESCPLCGLAIEALDDHTRRAHGATLIKVKSDLAAGLESVAGEMTRVAALYGTEIAKIRLADVPGRGGAMREGGYL